jgi:GT2 family glycosyltransferase
LPASVVIPTIGRAEKLERSLASIVASAPRPAEVVVVDQSLSAPVQEAVERFRGAGARLVRCEGRGRGRAVNMGLEAAGQETVLVTDDDCIVAPDWPLRGYERLSEDPRAIISGRVLADGDPTLTPSLTEEEESRDYSGELHVNKVVGGNMAVRRSELLRFGAFDERVVPSAEDNELCYRWLRAGRRLLFDPDMVVWHHDWRTPKGMEELYVTYARGQGVFYAKHLRAGDLGILRFVLRDLREGVVGVRDRYASGRPRSSDWRQGVLRGLPSGLVAGWRAFGDHQPSGR